MKVFTGILGVLLTTAAWGQTVDLEWRGPETVPVNGNVELGLYAVAGEETAVCAVGVIFQWSDSLAFVGVPENPPETYQWMLTDFPVEGEAFDGLNDTWADGNAYWAGLAQWGDPFLATPEGSLVATFEFAAYDDGMVSILPDVGGYCETQVMSAEVAGQNIVGQLGSAAVSVDWSLSTTAHDPPEVEAEDAGAGSLDDWRR